MDYLSSVMIYFIMPQKPSKELPPLNINGTVGQNVYKIRKDKGITQEELANKIGITQTLISKYEKGKLQISSDMLIRFAKALSTPADKILGLTQIEENKNVSLKISRRMNKIELLPESEQKALLKTIDTYLKAAHIE